MSPENYKKLDQVSNDILKYCDLVIQHLTPCGDDLILLTLKGHLVIENLLEINLLHLLAIESLPKKYGRLDFNQKLQLVRIVVTQHEPGPNADLFCVIQKLNELRNELAHNLKDHVQIENDVISFIKEYHTRAGVKAGSENALPAQLKESLLKLSKFMAAVRYHFYKIEI